MILVQDSKVDIIVDFKNLELYSFVPDGIFASLLLHRGLLHHIIELYFHKWVHFAKSFSVVGQLATNHFYFKQTAKLEHGLPFHFN